MSTTKDGLRFGQLRTPDAGDATAVLVVYTPSGQARFVELNDTELAALIGQANKAVARRIDHLAAARGLDQS